MRTDPGWKKRGLLTMAVLVGMLIPLLVGINLWRERQRTLQGALHEAEHRAETALELTQRTLEEAESILDFIGFRVSLAVTKGPLREAEIHALLKEAIRVKAPFAVAFLVDPRGRLVATSNRYPVGSQVVQEREYFLHHTQDSHLDLHVGRPMQHTRGGGGFVPLTKRLAGPKQRLDWIVGLGVEPVHFSESMAHLSLDPGDHLELHHEDGTLLARSFSDGSDPGRTLAEAPLEARCFSPRFHVGVRAILDRDQALRGWRRQARDWGLSTALILALFGALGWVTRHQVRQLQATRDEHLLLLDEAPSLIWKADATGRFHWFNRTWLEFRGRTSAQEAATGWLEGLAPGDRDRWLGDFHRALAARETLTSEFHLRDHRGQYRNVVHFGRPHVDAKGTFQGYLGYGFDVTDRVRAEAHRQALEAELAQARHQESLGVLAGGVAHDLNNALAVILGMASTLKGQPSPSPKVAKATESILSATHRARDIVNRLIAYSRCGLEEPCPVDLREVLVKACLPFHASAPTGIQWSLVLPAQAPTLIGDADTLVRAVGHLVSNALDAMPEGGRLRVSLTLSPGNMVVEVADSGPGMEAEVLAKAMDPFFTTKPQGQGTGLGLPVVHGTAKAHGGRLELQSTPGAGTIASLRFMTFEVPVEAPLAPRPGTGKLRVAIVDDEELLRTSVAALLAEMGHEPLTFSGGREALLHLETTPVDLVLLDYNMPDMNGLDTAGRLRSLRPELPIIVCSGHLTPQVLGELGKIPRLRTLAKPFEPKTLAALLAET